MFLDEHMIRSISIRVSIDLPSIVCFASIVMTPLRPVDGKVLFFYTNVFYKLSKPPRFDSSFPCVQLEAKALAWGPIVSAWPRNLLSTSDSGVQMKTPMLLANPNIHNQRLMVFSSRERQIEFIKLTYCCPSGHMKMWDTPGCQVLGSWIYLAPSRQIRT